MKKQNGFFTRHKKKIIISLSSIILILIVLHPLILKAKKDYDAQKNWQKPINGATISGRQTSEPYKYPDVLRNTEFRYAVAKGLAAINAHNLSEFRIIDRENLGDGDFEYTVKIVTDKRTLHAFVHYTPVTDSYLLISIDNAENKHTYFTPEGTEYLCDIYDYDTDKLISHAAE